MLTKQAVPQKLAAPPSADKKPTEMTEDQKVDIDDAQIEEPKDDAFKKGPIKEQPTKQRRKP